MKQFFIPILASCHMLFAACADNAKTPAPPTPEAPMVGNDQDAHGCKPSAGYQWSVVRGSCIRIFESGIRLDAAAPGADTTLSAFIVFKSDESDAQAELFMPKEATSQLLDQVKDDGAGTWKSATYTLSQWKGMYTLEDAAGKTLYQGTAVK
jgi:hypothetical protein